MHPRLNGLHVSEWVFFSFDFFILLVCVFVADDADDADDASLSRPLCQQDPLLKFNKKQPVEVVAVLLAFPRCWPGTTWMAHHNCGKR
jgi:hypothetical protein